MSATDWLAFGMAAIVLAAVVTLFWKMATPR
jgi:hypothetical protein